MPIPRVISAKAASGSRADIRYTPDKPGLGHKLALLLYALLALAALVALLSHDPGDPAWSTSGTHETIHNPLGVWGAWAADIGLTLLGYSVGWLLVLAFRQCLSMTADLIRPHDTPVLARDVSAGRRVLAQLRFWGGVVLLLISSCALEWTRLAYAPSTLPDHAGGVLGYAVGTWSVRLMGPDWAGVMWICVLVLSVSWALSFSWLRLADGLGGWLDVRRDEKVHREQEALDQRLGAEALRERELAGRPEPTLGLSHSLARDAELLEHDRARLGATGLAGTFPAAGIAPVASAPPVDDLPLFAPRAVPHPLQEAGRVTANEAVSTPTSSLVQPLVTPALDEPPPWMAAPPAMPLAPAPMGADSEPPAFEAFSSFAPEPPAPSFDEPPAYAPVAAMPDLPPPVPQMPPVAPVAAPARIIGAAPARVVPSARLMQEQQSSLISDDGGAHPLPPLRLLDPPPEQVQTVDSDMLEMTSRMIEKKLKDFGVSVSVVAAYPGPVITRYEIEPATGVKGSQIVNLAKDLARSLALMSIRVVETIPGKNCMALELPNARRSKITLSEVVGSDVYDRSASMLTLSLGKDIVGQPMVADLGRMPHCLVAGTTGSGKSVGINAMIVSVLYKARAEDVRMILIDPKMLELSIYEGIPHLLCPVVTDMKQAGNALNWCVAEMERRYKLMSRMQVRNIAGFNKKVLDAKARGELLMNPLSMNPEAPEPLDTLPFIVVVIDELADLMMVVGKKVEELIARLAQKARAAGIHLILATQRPSVDVITGLIKANVPTRLSFQVSSKIDSRTILDQMGAEALLGMGDMLFMPAGTGLPERVHGAFVSDEEVLRVVSFLKEHGEPNYIEGLLEGGTLDDDNEGSEDAMGIDAETDALYDQAVQIVITERRASTSFVQRKLRIGYNRAARLLEQMESAGIVSAMSGSNNRDILVPPPSH